MFLFRNVFVLKMSLSIFFCFNGFENADVYDSGMVFYNVFFVFRRRAFYTAFKPVCFLFCSNQKY